MDTVHGFEPRHCQMLLLILAGLRKSLQITEVSTFFYFYLNIFSLFLLSIFFLPWQSVFWRGWNWVVAHMEVNICGLNYWKIRKFKNKNKMNVRSPSSLSCYLFCFCIRSKNAFCHNNNNNSLPYYPGISNYWVHIKVLCFLTCSQN